MSNSRQSGRPASWKIAFRVDASLQIGSGHVMRCLTLATALRAQGAECHFICREHPGDLIAQIHERDFSVTTLAAMHPDAQAASPGDESLPGYAAWLGCHWQEDAEATLNVLDTRSFDWLVVDHYALDYRWEHRIRSHCSQVMVIDDLADRRHDCDLLMDQNLGRKPDDYAGLVPEACRVLAGTPYALVRPDFAELRKGSLQRRHSPRLRRLLVSMGGVDQNNATGAILSALERCQLPNGVAVTVVMGAHSPWLRTVQARAANLPWPCEVRVNVSDMANLMAESDLAIGAGGGTSWERCVLGVPSVVVVLADNQVSSAKALAKAGAVYVIANIQSVAGTLPRLISSLRSDELSRCSHAASAICDGCGTSRVVNEMITYKYRVRPMLSSDLDIVLRWRNHESVRGLMYTQHEITTEEHHAWFERSKADSLKHILIVERLGRPIGFVQFNQTKNGVAEWGFYANPDAHRGSGHALAHAALGYAFDQLGFQEVTGDVLAFNERSIYFHQKLGFQFQGVRASVRCDGPSHHNVHQFRLSAEGWRMGIMSLRKKIEN